MRRADAPSGNWIDGWRMFENGPCEEIVMLKGVIYDLQQPAYDNATASDYQEEKNC